MTASFLPENAIKPEVSQPIQTIHLEQIRLAVHQALTRELLHGIEVNDVRASDTFGFLSNTIAIQVAASVWSDPSHEHRKTYTIKTDPVYASWKHHFIDSQPINSFAHSFFSKLWNIEDPSPHQVEHTVEVIVPAVLPELQRRFPDEFGRLHFPIQIHGATTA